MQPLDVDREVTRSDRVPVDNHADVEAARMLADGAALGTRNDVQSTADAVVCEPASRASSEDADGADTTITDADADVDNDPLERSLQRMLQTQCFSGIECRTTTFLYTTQLTHSNVVSTVVTSRAFSLQRRQSALRTALQASSSSTTTRTIGGSANQDNNSAFAASASSAAAHVYSQPCNPKKVRNPQKGRYQAQLPAFRRSLPALPVPAARLHAELVAERDTFMAQLAKERDAKAVLESWAATKIQACYRGYRARPRLLTFQLRQKLNSLRAIRHDLSDMNETLKRTVEEVPDTDVNSLQQQLSSWRHGVRTRASRKRSVRSWKDRAHAAATLIQASVKRFLARIGYAHMLARHDDEVRLNATIRVQSVIRGFQLRCRIHRVVAKLQLAAIVQIQSLIRGIQARERVCILRFEQLSERRRRAGAPLQFTLPSRMGAAAAASPLRVLVANRQTRAKREFKTAAWHNEQMYLRIHKVAVKLCINNRSILHRRLLAEALALPKKQRRPRSSSAQQKKSSAQLQLKGSSPSRRRDVALTSSGGASGPLSSSDRPMTPSSSSSRIGSAHLLMASPSSPSAAAMPLPTMSTTRSGSSGRSASAIR